MNNIRISIDLTKVEGARTIKATAPSGKQEFYVAIPVKSLFLPKEKKSVYLTCTMIPCPNALYGDFMLKPYINGTQYANMSDEERRAMPIIGKGTYIEQKLDKEAAKGYERIDVQTVASLDEIGQGEGIAPVSNAQFPAESGTPEAVTLYVVDTNGAYYQFNDWASAELFANQNPSFYPIIESYRGEQRLNRYEYNPMSMQWQDVASPMMNG